MTEKQSHIRGDIWAVISALTTAIGLTIAKIILEDIPPLTFNTYVFLFGSVIILGHSAVNGNLKKTIVVPVADLGFYFILAILFAGSTFCLFTALTFIEPATVSFLSRLELIATLLLAVMFLKEQISRAEILGLLFVLAGIIVMRYGASMELSRAVLLVSIQAILVGTAEVLIKHRIKRINPGSLIFYRGLFMVIIFLIAGTALDQIIWVRDWRLILLLLAAAFFMPYLGRFSYLKAMENINISRASIIVQSQPFFAVGFTLLLIGTFPSMRELSGGFLIVGGVILIKLLEKRHHRKKP
ncbi:MAG: DMT family transporter [candidate division Zixibacteria bacterium]|nr:DMT family transporter [candidate division Zixibacteria bacterium]